MWRPAASPAITGTAAAVIAVLLANSPTPITSAATTASTSSAGAPANDPATAPSRSPTLCASSAAARLNPPPKSSSTSHGSVRMERPSSRGRRRSRPSRSASATTGIVQSAIAAAIAIQPSESEAKGFMLPTLSSATNGRVTQSTTAAAKTTIVSRCPASPVSTSRCTSAMGLGATLTTPRVMTHQAIGRNSAASGTPKMSHCPKVMLLLSSSRR